MEGLFGILLLFSLFYVDRGQTPNLPPVFLYIESEEAFQFSRQIVEVAKGIETANKPSQGTETKKKPVRGMKIQLEASETSYWQSLNADPRAIGLRLGLVKLSNSEVPQLHLTFSTSGDLSEAIVDTLRLAIQGAYLTIAENPNAPVIDVVSREDKTQNTQLTQNQLILPVYLTLNIIMATMWYGFSLKRSDSFDLQGDCKPQGRPINGHSLHLTHMIAIVLSFVMVGIAITIGLIGVPSYSLHLILLVFSGSIFALITGVFIRAVFKTGAVGNGVMIAVQIIQIIPLVSYFLPSFNAWWLRIIPSYSFLVLFKELLRSDWLWDAIAWRALFEFSLNVSLFSGMLLLCGLLWHKLKYKIAFPVVIVAIITLAIFYLPSSRMSFINIAVIDGAQASLIAELKTLGKVSVVEDRDALNRMIDGIDDTLGIDTTQITPQIILEGDEVLMPQLFLRGVLDRHLSQGKPQLLIVDHEARPKIQLKMKTEASGLFRVPLVTGTLISVLILVLRCVVYIGLTGKFKLSLSTFSR